VHTRGSDPCEIWKTLKEAHEARGLGTRMSLRRRLHSVTKADDVSMQTYISTMQELAQRLRDLGSAIDDEELIVVITRGLPDKYDSVVVSLDGLSVKELTLGNVSKRLLNEEARRSDGHTAESAAVALRAEAFKSVTVRERTCWTCKKTGHIARNCPDRKEKEKERKEEDFGAYAIAY
jgi:gag-polypeptide of LTR copia-type/Zinc knuckle